MQHFRDEKNPRNLPIDTNGVRQIAWEQKNTQRYVMPVPRPPHDGRSYREIHGEPSRRQANNKNKKRGTK